MNPLPRLLGLGLLIILVALAAMLAVSTRHAVKPVSPASVQAVNPPSPTPSPSARLVEFSQRMSFPLALTGLALTVALLASLGVHHARTGGSRAPFATDRAEMGALANLAKSSVAQGEQLARERSVRQRAEEDALLSQQLLNQSLEEKIRLGRDLHDGIIQSLYAAGLTIESARAQNKTDPAEADRRLVQCRENLNQSIRDIRTYIAGLAPENLRQVGFAQALNSLVTELGAGRDTEFELKIDDAATAQLSPEQSADALQIAREAISNSLRHGNASQIRVRLQPGDNEVCLLVQDNGAGFEVSRRAGTGHGLTNMEARASRLGATMRVESNPQSGTRVVLTLPLRPR